MLWLEVDPSTVVAGWLPLILILMLGLVIAGLFLSMRTHLRRANDMPTEAQVRQQRRAEAAARREAATGADGTSGSAETSDGDAGVAETAGGHAGEESGDADGQEADAAGTDGSTDATRPGVTTSGRTGSTAARG